MNMQWFVLRVQAGKEDKIVEALHKKLRIQGLEHLVDDVVVPKRKETMQQSDGSLVTRDVKIFPGYIYLHAALYEESDNPGEEEMELRDDLYYLIKETPSVGDFTGSVGRPTPMQQDDVDRIFNRAPVPAAGEEATAGTAADGGSDAGGASGAGGDAEGGATPPAGGTVHVPFEVGDHIRVRDGHTFGGFEGHVDDIDTTTGKVRVSVIIFNRPTDVDLLAHEIEKISSEE